ncbi:MAG TPA: serine/threonine-protein kinase [Polyangiaceae bacterium]
MNQAQAPSPLERTVLPGTRLGRYEIITHLAAGGMATVFLARLHGVAGFQRLVAIKLLHPHIAADQQFTTMFLDEARLAARIRHPNVVPTVDLQHGPEGHYLVMEFIEGESLLGLLRQTVKLNKPMPAGVAIRIMLDALAGLHAAHELTGDSGEGLQLVHRDVSPHNILVGVDGIARIVDFGIARAEERIGTTRDGQVKGKLAYMAPEQTSGENVDRRVDVFTAGIVLFESLTGRRLFRGATDAEVLRNLIDKPIPRLREVSPGYPQALEDVVSRALQRDPEARFDTASDFAEALEQAAEPLGIATPKQVGAYVRETAGELVDSLMRRARAFQEGARVSSIPKLELTENPDSAVRTSGPSASAAASAPSAQDLLDMPPELTRSRRPLVVGAAAAVLVLAGAIVATVTLGIASHDARVAAPAPAKTAEQKAAVAAPAETAPIETTTEPGISVTDLPRADQPVAVRRRHVVPIAASAPPPPPSASAAPKPVTTAKVAPAGSAFNPESM